MKVTVSDGTYEKSCELREGTLASEAITALGFDFPMPCGGRGLCGKCRCLIGGREAAACKTPLFADTVIHVPKTEFSVVGADDNVSGAEGVVIDIGTTTVAAARFEGGAPTASLGRKNPQCAYGADVISRMGTRDTRPLTEAVRSLVGELRERLGPHEPTVIVGNTAMLALFAGLDVSGMGVWPFTPPSAFDAEFDGAYLPPCPSAFIGADALCSLLWSGAAGRPEAALVADLGTNGELLLVSGGEVYAASAAAGPALEGAGISCGMAAGEGAVFRVNEGGCSVIGGGEARGLCGSGLVDAVALMLKSGFMDKTGRIERDFELPCGGLRITQADVRAYQLCKAAILAAAAMTLEAAGVERLDRIYLSGALGKSVNAANAALTGLLPPCGDIRAIGNGALMGGAMLLNEKNRGELRSLAARCRTVDTAEDPRFAEKYIEAMNF